MFPKIGLGTGPFEGLCPFPIVTWLSAEVITRFFSNPNNGEGSTRTAASTKTTRNRRNWKIFCEQNY